MKTRKNNQIGLFGGYYVMDKQSKRILLFLFIKHPSKPNTYAGVILDNFVDHPGMYTLSELKKVLGEFKKRGPHYSCVCYNPDQLVDKFKKHGASKFYTEKWFTKNMNFCAHQVNMAYPSHTINVQAEIKKICESELEKK